MRAVDDSTPGRDDARDRAKFIDKEVTRAGEVRRKIYEDTVKPLTHTKTYEKVTHATDAGARCEGCGWPSSRFPTRRAFLRHREDCE